MTWQNFDQSKLYWQKSICFFLLQKSTQSPIQQRPAVHCRRHGTSLPPPCPMLACAAEHHHLAPGCRWVPRSCVSTSSMLMEYQISSHVTALSRKSPVQCAVYRPAEPANIDVEHEWPAARVLEQSAVRGAGLEQADWPNRLCTLY
jgi:hypothetical protein